MTVIHHVRVTGTAGGVRIGETGKLVFARPVEYSCILDPALDGKGLRAEFDSSAVKR